MSAKRWVELHNTQTGNRAEAPVLGIGEFRETILQMVGAGSRLASFFALPAGKPAAHRLVAVLSKDRDGRLSWLETETSGAYPSLTPDCPQAWNFECELAEQYGIKPEQHPWFKPVRFLASTRKTGGALPGVMNFFRNESDEVHEVAVGPVHAGIIEPGHFRFQCMGETVEHLEIALGYQHRGVERALTAEPEKRRIHYIETLAGDTTIGHVTAYCQAWEALAACQVPARAQAIRALALELERLANHTGDLGALAGDVGYLPTAAFCGRLRGDFLNLTAELCGNRFGRGLVRPGGVAFDLDAGQIEIFRRRLTAAFRDLTQAVNLLWGSASVLARFENTGRLSRKTSQELGMVGPAARACGLERDVRFDFPAGWYRVAHLPIATANTGDVFARAYVRWLEIQRSVTFLQEQLQALPTGPVRVECGAPAPGKMVVSLVEAWRGEVCHVALTDEAGKLERYKVVDPSFHNWMGLAQAMRNGQISDFPLCNKSFSLSYCGHDL